MREKGFRAVGGLAQRLTSGMAGRRQGGRGGKSGGASVARLKAEWSAIVGHDLPRVNQPEALLAGRRGQAGKAPAPRRGAACGPRSAPNIIIDYFSLTCPHCANFHAAVLPQLKRDWIDNGRARFIYRHYPSDAIATHASQLSECGGAARFFATVDALFRTQVDWLTAPDPDSEMVKAAETAGIAGAGQWLANDRLLHKV